MLFIQRPGTVEPWGVISISQCEFLGGLVGTGTDVCWGFLSLLSVAFAGAPEETPPHCPFKYFEWFHLRFFLVQVEVYHLQVILSTEIIKCGLKWLLQNSWGFPTLRLFIARIIWEFAEFHMFPCEFTVFCKTKWITQLSCGQMGQAVWQPRSQRCLVGSGQDSFCQLSPSAVGFWKCCCHLKDVSRCWRPEKEIFSRNLSLKNTTNPHISWFSLSSPCAASQPYLSPTLEGDYGCTCAWGNVPLPCKECPLASPAAALPCRECDLHRSCCLSLVGGRKHLHKAVRWEWALICKNGFFSGGQGFAAAVMMCKALPKEMGSCVRHAQVGRHCSKSQKMLKYIGGKLGKVAQNYWLSHGLLVNLVAHKPRPHKVCSACTKWVSQESV